MHGGCRATIESGQTKVRSCLPGHSFASASLGLVGQPQLQKYIQGELKKFGSIPSPVRRWTRSVQVLGELTRTLN